MKNLKSMIKSFLIIIAIGFISSCEEAQAQSSPTNQDKVAETDNSSKEIFLVVEDMPTYPDGKDAFFEYISNNLKYPAEAKKAGIEGKVFVQFVVDKTGKVSDVKAIKGLGSGCDKEAVRVIKESVPWNPGSQRGIKVNVRFTMPITFKLG